MEGKNSFSWWKRHFKRLKDILKHFSCYIIIFCVYLKVLHHCHGNSMALKGYGLGENYQLDGGQWSAVLVYRNSCVVFAFCARLLFSHSSGKVEAGPLPHYHCCCNHISGQFVMESGLPLYADISFLW